MSDTIRHRVPWTVREVILASRAQWRRRKTGASTQDTLCLRVFVPANPSAWMPWHYRATLARLAARTT